MGDVFQSEDHDELTKHIVIRPDGEAAEPGGTATFADNYDELPKPVERPDGEAAEPSGETFYSDDYEAVTGRVRDGSIRGGGDATVSVETKVVAPPRIQPAKSSAVVVETE